MTNDESVSHVEKDINCLEDILCLPTLPGPSDFHAGIFIFFSSTTYYYFSTPRTLQIKFFKLSRGFFKKKIK